MANAHFVCFADTVYLHTENNTFHHIPFTIMHFQCMYLVDFVYMFRNVVNVYKQ